MNGGAFGQTHAAPTIIGPRAVAVVGVDKELESIWKSLVPATPAESSAVMQASVVNLAAVTDSAAAADAASEVMIRLMSRAPSRFIVLDSEPDADPPGIDASVSVVCERAGERQLCCEQIRINAKGISADALPSTAEAFYVPDLPVMVWWSAPLKRPDFREFAARADRMVIDSMMSGLDELRTLAGYMTHSRKTRTAVGDLNWARLTPYRQLFAQFFDSAEWREQLNKIESVSIEARASAGLLMAGWLISRLHQPPKSVTREQITVKIADGGGLVFRSLVMKCAGGEFEVRRASSETVEAHATVGGETTSRVSRIPLPSIEKLLSDEISRSGRDRAYDAAVRAAVE